MWYVICFILGGIVGIILFAAFIIASDEDDRQDLAELMVKKGGNDG
uniref:Uncharacterized protein n=1 Tax=viral metagenome TaxID=1070528 RepID=A0A6H2A2F2_9ZZZZ